MCDVTGHSHWIDNVRCKMHQTRLQVIVKERHETIMGYKPRERVALEWFIPIIVELLVL